nr:paraquat-inducible protein A [Candidimonas humi]
MHERAPIPVGAQARCRRCDHALYHHSRLGPSGWLAVNLTALIVFALANCFPVATLRLNGMTIEATLPDALILTWEQGHEVVAMMTGLFGFALPLAQLLFLLWALVELCLRRVPGDFGLGMRVLAAVPVWSMIPVLMLGILVAIVKLSGLATLVVGPGLWGFAGLTVLMTTLTRTGARHLWREAEDAGLVEASGAALVAGLPVAACESCGCVQNLEPGRAEGKCRRCGAALHLRKPIMASRAWACVAGAAILYIPANLLPVMLLRTPAGTSAHTILGGVIELWQLGSWDLAIVVFVASIVVPMTKLFALAYLLLHQRWQGVEAQRQRTRLYEFVEFIGQWSMLDVFVVILLSAMADFPGFTQVTAGPGAASFGLVVVLTMFAAMSYDPRSGWDARKAAQDTAMPAIEEHHRRATRETA